LFLVLIIVCLSYVVRSRVLAIARAAADTVDERASCCATILVAARGPEPTDPFESRMFSIPFNSSAMDSSVPRNFPVCRVRD
jgi:hypothetical protein